jgi:uncharacterized protein (DUF58 family)
MAKLRNRRWRRHLKFTREGKLFVFVTVGLGFGAVNTGTNLMYLVFAFMLSLIILSGILSEHVLRRLRISRRLPSRVFAGEPTLIEIVARNTKTRLVSYSVEIEDRAQDLTNDRRCYFLKIPPGNEQAASYRRVFPRRGRVSFESFRVATRFPFALFEKWRELPGEDTLIVYPARLATPLPKGLSHDLGDRKGQARGRGTETRELRDYRESDELRAVHWRRTAALGRPIVREFEREAGELLSIAIDNGLAAGDGAGLARLEEQISRAADLTERALARGHSVEICARGERTPPLAAYASSDALLRFLALLQPAAPEVPLAAPTRGARVVDMRPLASGQGERAA